MVLLLLTFCLLPLSLWESNYSMFCCSLHVLYVHSSIEIIWMGKKELVALLNLSSWCLVVVERLFLVVPRGCLRFVIVVFLDHTHLFLSVPEFIRKPTATSDFPGVCVWGGGRTTCHPPPPPRSGSANALTNASFVITYN